MSIVWCCKYFESGIDSLLLLCYCDDRLKNILLYVCMVIFDLNVLYFLFLNFVDYLENKEIVFDWIM